jgi:histone H3/H4
MKPIHDFRFKKDAFLAIQEATENFITEMFEDANKCATQSTFEIM